MDRSPIRLEVELVPETCWFSNVRSEVRPKEWDSIRRAAYAAAKFKCEICGGQGRKHPVECHEVWDYDDVNRIQKLVRMIALCPACHEVKHIGLAEIRGRGPQAMKHLAKVNGWTPQQTVKYVSTVFEIWQHRSGFKWKLDVGHLTSYGIDVAALERRRDDRVERRSSADQLGDPDQEDT